MRIELLDLVRLDVVLQAVVVLLRDEVAVRSVQEHQVVDVVRGGVLGSLASILLPCWVVWLQALDELRDQLEPRLGLALHQEDDALREHLVVHELLLLELEVVGPLEVVVRLIEVFLLNLDFGDFIKG